MSNRFPAFQPYRAHGAIWEGCTEEEVDDGRRVSRSDLGKGVAAFIMSPFSCSLFSEIWFPALF